VKSSPSSKRCPGCGRGLPLSGFPLDASRRTGRCTYCRECTNRRSADYYARQRREKLRKMEAKRRAAGIQPRGWMGLRGFEFRERE
jgi:hypothetical protein